MNRGAWTKTDTAFLRSAGIVPITDGDEEFFCTDEDEQFLWDPSYRAMAEGVESEEDYEDYVPAQTFEAALRSYERMAVENVKIRREAKVLKAQAKRNHSKMLDALVLCAGMAAIAVCSWWR